jgi:hypothetical protein
MLVLGYWAKAVKSRGITNILVNFSLICHCNSCVGGFTQVCPIHRMECFFSLYLVSLLSSRLTASAVMWSSNFLKCLARHVSTSLNTVLIFTTRSSLIQWLFVYQGALRMNRRVFDWKCRNYQGTILAFSWRN